MSHRETNGDVNPMSNWWPLPRKQQLLTPPTSAVPISKRDYKCTINKGNPSDKPNPYKTLPLIVFAVQG